MAESIFEALFFGQPKSITNSRNNIANANNLNSNEPVRLNNFAHVNYSNSKIVGKLLCLNGCGIHYKFLKLSNISKRPSRFAKLKAKENIVNGNKS